MGLKVSPCAEGELCNDTGFTNPGNWNIGTFWTIAGGGTANFAAPGDAASFCYQNFTPVIDHLYKAVYTLDVVNMEPGNGFEIFIADARGPRITAAGNYLWYHKVEAILANYFAFTPSFIPADPGRSIVMSYYSVFDLTCTIAHQFGIAVLDFTMYEYWLLDNDRVMFTFANLNGHQNVTLIYDPN